MIIPTYHSEPSFLHNLNAQIEGHISDEKLTVHRLLRLIAMSRTNLHRKLTRSVGMSATEYIRYVRLHRAAELLLENRDWTIYCVALEVGFSSQSYFTKRFREVFGICPAAWRQRHVEHMCE